MKTNHLLLATSLSCALVLPSTATAEKVTGIDVVSAFENNFGVHEGQRRNHTKGICAVGEFTGVKGLQDYSQSALFSGEPVPVIFRFSLPGGNPNAPDFAKSPRGMALEFKLPNGELQHMTMLNTPMFGAATPESFYAGLLAAAPDEKTGKPNPEKIKAYRQAHPDSLAQAQYMGEHNPPASYANSAFFGIHTFFLENQKGDKQKVRWQFNPADGVQELSNQELADLPANFLKERLQTRLEKGAIQWKMHITLGEKDDTETNPTLLWPAERKQLAAGTLSLTSLDSNECDAINFDPLVMGKGIQPSADPILQFRSQAYAVSFAKRLSGK